MTNKYLNEYIYRYGFDDLIPVNWFNDKRFKSIEDVYKKALEAGITWRELTGWNEDRKKNVAL